MAMRFNSGGFWFFFFFIFFAGGMDFDLGLRNLLTQVTDEEMLELEALWDVQDTQEMGSTGGDSQEARGGRLSLTGKAKTCVYSEEPRSKVSIILCILLYYVCVLWM